MLSFLMSVFMYFRCFESFAPLERRCDFAKLWCGKKMVTVNNDLMSGSVITPCNKIDKPLVVYRFLGNVMTSITTLCTKL